MKDLTVLVVDDNDFERNLLIKALSRKSNFSTRSAKSGEECLDLVATTSIHLILMDIMMPGTSGIEVLEQLRKRSNPVELPIIMVTAKDQTQDVVDCLKMGANDYITKPVNFEVAVSRIRTHAQLAQMAKEMSRLQQRAALDAMITTFNHEINNPLTIALSCIDSPEFAVHPIAEKLKTALWRIADIVKKIDEVAGRKEVEFCNYTGSTQMIKVPSSGNDSR